MPRRSDLNSIMIIGAGPIVIGQACEFDYSGTQACKALKEEGYRIILVNSNPATIMTDSSMANATYIEPITPDILEKIISHERPDALLPTVGGQTSLNATLALVDNGVLDKYNLKLIGAQPDVIRKAEDRELFKQAMTNIGQETARAKVVSNLEEGIKSLEKLGLPTIIRPSFTLGGEGGGIANNMEEFTKIVDNGLRLSPIGEVLIEESLIGWKEFEFEVIRDQNDNCIIICSIENIDPMGIHTGDSITVTPALTLTDKEYQFMRRASIDIIREIGVETGGSNVQFALNPEDGRIIVIEMNPRVSRSSALASKATGFPIAKIAALLAVGYTLDELKNDITGSTPASFEPTIDYVVTKFPFFSFEKFPGCNATLTTSMKSVGEVMAIGRSFQESLQKGLRSLEIGLDGLNEIDCPDISDDEQSNNDFIKIWLSEKVPDRILRIASAMRKGISLEVITATTGWDKWFLEQILGIITAEQNFIRFGLPNTLEKMLVAKNMGFSDARLAKLTNNTKSHVYKKRYELNLHPVFKRIDTCAAEFSSKTAYMYSSYEVDFNSECEANPSSKRKIIILGGGPNRIGQGIEFDYCCVHAAYSLSDIGFETIMINCNPETVSTDFDTSDKLYFEPLTSEDVLEIIFRENMAGDLCGVIVQLGGQTPLKICKDLEKAEVPILGTPVDSIDLAEDRKRFLKLISKLNLKQPQSGIAKNIKQAISITERIGFPVVIRPSYVLGGRAMEIVHDIEELNYYMEKNKKIFENNHLLIDTFLRSATEVDVDALCDSKSVFIAGIMEHIEEAGIHSGDSACSLPPQNLSKKILDKIRKQTKLLALKLKVRGLINIQFAVKDEEVYILEVNPRASRTVPFVAKTTATPIVKIAARLMAGEMLNKFSLTKSTMKYVAVKEAVFPFSRFTGTDVFLGPEMKSTGEVMGIDNSFSHAFAKSQLAANISLPNSGTIFISVKDEDKGEIAIVCKHLVDSGFQISATNGTAKFLRKKDFMVESIKKVSEGSPNVIDLILSNKIQLIINTASDPVSTKDSFSMRQTAVMKKIPYYTTVAGAMCVANAIQSIQKDSLKVKSLQEHYK